MWARRPAALPTCCCSAAPRASSRSTSDAASWTGGCAPTPRVIVREGVNARALTSDDVPHAVGVVTIDVAFISLRLILPSLPPFLEEGADVVALVKPQFEAGRDEVGKRGLVTDPSVHEAVLARVTEAAGAAGFRRVGMTPSPITGATGNQEFFLHLR